MTSREESQSASRPSSVPPGRNRRKWILAGAALPVVLLAFLILGTPRNYRVSAIPEKLELLTIQRIMQKLTASLLNEEGKFVECATVSLAPEEVNVLLTNGLRAAQFRKADKEKPTFTGCWTDGKLHFQISQPVGFLAVNLDSKIVPDLRDGKLSVRVDSARIGWLPLPSFLVQHAANRALAELEKKNEVRTIVALFQSIQVKGGHLEIRFYPKNLNSLFSIFLT